MHDLHIAQQQGLASAHNDDRHSLPIADALRQDQSVALTIVDKVCPIWRVCEQPGLGAQPEV
jgi:hypothetical protein